MQITVTNITAGERVYWTSAYKDMAPGDVVTTSRSALALAGDESLRKLAIAAKVSIAIVQEAGDADQLSIYTNATRPAPALVPIGTSIFNTDDGFPNVSNGTNWLDPTGTIT